MLYESRHKYVECVKSHVCWISHATLRLYESYRTKLERVMSHASVFCMRRATYMLQSHFSLMLSGPCHTYVEWAISYLCYSESSQKYIGWVMSHICLHRNILSESCHTYVYTETYWVSHVTHMFTYVLRMFEWVMSYICHTCVEWVMAHIYWTRRSTHTLNTSRDTLIRCSCQMNCQAVCRQMLTLGEVVCAWWWFGGGRGGGLIVLGLCMCWTSHITQIWNAWCHRYVEGVIPHVWWCESRNHPAPEGSHFGCY